ncbi:MAG: uroporphyrinogen decarboxylase family protein [Defluviitaleaceae bacterium]|nr:uroporphyrinogen decarboxylase family protein [Defluviitaleaceae bacterium]
MKDATKRKLDLIGELYPKGRQDKSRERLKSLWNGERARGGLPFTHAGFCVDYYDELNAPEERLQISLDEIIMRGRLRDDYVPGIFPGCRQATLPSMFGAREIVIGRDRATEKIIRSAEDVDRLREPQIEGTIAGEWLEMQEYFLNETEGKIGVHAVDMQGPVDVAGKLWGYDNLFASAYDDPASYHRLLEKTTGAFIMFWERQKKLLGEAFVPTHLFGWSYAPGQIGATVSVDSVVMVSPAFFEEFYLPYLNRIAGAFGGLAIHSCGNFLQHMDGLNRADCVRGVNAGQLGAREMYEAGLGKDKVAIACCDLNGAAGEFEYFKSNGINADLTVWGIWPKHNGKAVPIGEMSGAFWMDLREKEEALLIASGA